MTTESQKSGPRIVVTVQEKEDEDLNPGGGNGVGEETISLRNIQR